MISKSRSVSRAVSDVVGSSKMRMRASTERALATSTSCRSPGARRSTRTSGETSRSTRARDSWARLRICAAV